jgi:hypothetical protein
VFLPKRTGRELSTVAAHLCNIASDLGALAGTLRWAPGHTSELLHTGHLLLGGVTVYLHPEPAADQATRTAMVDMLSAAVLGHPGADREMGDGMWQHTGDGHRGPVEVCVLTRIEDPTKTAATLAEKDAEIARLRAELAQAKAPAGDEPRCPTCGELTTRNIGERGAVGHSGDEHGNDCLTRGVVRYQDVTGVTEPTTYELSTDAQLGRLIGARGGYADVGRATDGTEPTTYELSTARVPGSTVRPTRIGPDGRWTSGTVVVPS